MKAEVLIALGGGAFMGMVSRSAAMTWWSAQSTTSVARSSVFARICEASCHAKERLGHLGHLDLCFSVVPSLTIVAEVPMQMML